MLCNNAKFCYAIIYTLTYLTFKILKMTVKERLTEYIHSKQISTREFCRTIGVSETYVNSSGMFRK